MIVRRLKQHSQSHFRNKHVKYLIRVLEDIPAFSLRKTTGRLDAQLTKIHRGCTIRNQIGAQILWSPTVPENYERIRELSVSL